MSNSLWCQVLEWMSCVRIDIFNNINFNQAAEEVLLFRWELMKRKRHTYGTLFLFLCVSHPSICAQIHTPYGKARMTRSKSSMHFQSFSKCSWRIKKGLPLLSHILPWAHESEGCTCSPFNDGLFWRERERFLFHLEQIFIVNPLPVARFGRAAPYVARCLTTFLLNQGFQICHFDMFHNETARFTWADGPY